MHLLKSFIIAFAMYSRIPVPKVEWEKESMRYVFCFFPLIGVVIGALELLWMWIAAMLGAGDILRTAVMVLLPVAVTGGIHLDGLLDTADALSSYKTMEEKLEILKDSHAGAFAILVGISYFLLYFGVLSEADVWSMEVLGVGFVLSRALSGLAIASFRMAKNTGLAATFSSMAVKSRVRWVMAVYIAACAALMIWINPVCGCAAVAGALLTFLGYRHMAYKKFGGITGDLAGFFLQVCELVMAACVVITRMVVY